MAGPRQRSSQASPAEVVEQAEEGQQPAEGQEGADEAVELRPRPDQVDHQEVGARVGQQQQQRAGGVGGCDGTEGEKRADGRASGAPAGASAQRTSGRFPSASCASTRTISSARGRSSAVERHSSRRSATIRRTQQSRPSRTRRCVAASGHPWTAPNGSGAQRRSTVEGERGRDRLAARAGADDAAPYDASSGQRPLSVRALGLCG